jgi:hypothetical protein
VLGRKAASRLKRPVGRPSRKPKAFSYNVRYRAGSWACAHRAVVKVEWHAGALFPRAGFLVTDRKGRALAGTGRTRPLVYPCRGPRTREGWLVRGRAPAGRRLAPFFPDEIEPLE